MFSVCWYAHAASGTRSHCNVVIVSVPPDILDYPTSTDMVVREGSNVTLRCAATGTPEPTVTWRREAGGTISLSNWHEGTYLCASAITIASSDANWVRYSVTGLLPQIEGFPLVRSLCPLSTLFRRYLASRTLNVTRSQNNICTARLLLALKQNVCRIISC